MLYLAVTGILAHIHDYRLSNAKTLLNRLFQIDKNVCRLDYGNFHQPLFLAAGKRP